MFHKKILLFLSTGIISNVLTQAIPENPCPQVFSYQTNGNGNIYGHTSIPYDGSNMLVFSVNASFKTLFQGKKMTINLVNPPRSTVSSEKLEYDIYFPITNVIPKITEINFNGRIYCRGPPEPLTPEGITNLWASHYYQFYSSNYGSPNIFNQIPQEVQKPVQIPATSTEKPFLIFGNQQFPNNSQSDILGNSQKVKDDELSDLINSIFTSPMPDNVKGVQTISKTSSGFQCGVSSLAVPLVLGGTEVSEGQFPWLCALFAYNTQTNSYDYKCTANLISDRHVITAARCIQYYKVQLVATEDILIILGSNDLSHWATRGAVTRSASDVVVHPDFKNNPTSANADMALITLTEPVSFSKTIKPICLWEQKDIALNNFVNKQGLVAGWGKDEKTSGLNIYKSKYVQIPIISQVDCLKSNAIIAKITSENTFCAGDLTGSGPCIGDGGAGFIISQNGAFYLRGISSRTITDNGVCSLEENYAIFCDIAKFMPWIQEAMNK